MFKATGAEFYPDYDIEYKTVKCALRSFVKLNGGILYPNEIGVDYHGWVDAACIIPSTEELYGFEIKENGDSITTGIEQCKGYQSAFDYTYIVGAVKPKKESLMRMERLGIGYVQILFEVGRLKEINARVHCHLKAPLNHPLPKQRRIIVGKFQRYSTYKHSVHNDTRRLTDYAK